MQPVLAIRRAAIAFGSLALFRGLDLELMPGQMAGLAGESGSGKTSLLRAVLGFVPLTEGSIEVAGIPLDVHHIDDIRRQTAYLPQELQPVAATGHDLVALTHALRANRDRSTQAGVEAALRDLALEPSILDLAATKLSGGQRQRILLAAALAMPKPLLLLDEPTSALDAETTTLVIAALRRRLRDEHRAALVVSHSSRLLEACDFTLTIQA